MSVADPRLVSGGLLVGSDMISLADGLDVQQRILHDTAVGARHVMHKQVITAVSALQEPIAYYAWLSSSGLTTDEAAEVLRFVNSIGGLRIQRSWHGALDAVGFAAKLVVHGLRPVLHMWRGRANCWGILLGVTRAGLWILPLVPSTTAALWFLGTPTAQAVSVSLLCFAIFWTSTVLHELTHLAWLRGTSGAVVQQGLRLGILHGHVPQRHEKASALSGPLVGVVTALVIGWLAGMWWLGGLFALAQAWSLVPWYGDGKVLWRRKKKGNSWNYSNAAKDNEFS